jgi:Ca2+-binding EF-hand superfamily protein
MLKKFNLNVPARLVEPVLQRIDRNQSGYIEFDEFKKFLYYSAHEF